MQGAKDVEIVADGVEMICTETTRALTIAECENLRIRGLVIDYDPLPYTQGRIVALSADSMVHEIELFAGYPPAEDISGEKYEIFRGDTRTLRYGSYHQIEVEKLSSTRIRVTKGSPYRGEKWKLEQVGDIIAIAARHAPGGQLPHAISVENSKHVTLEDMTVYASNAFGFRESACSGTIYRRCRVDRRPQQSDLQNVATRESARSTPTPFTVRPQPAGRPTCSAPRDSKATTASISKAISPRYAGRREPLTGVGQA